MAASGIAVTNSHAASAARLLNASTRSGVRLYPHRLHIVSEGETEKRVVKRRSLGLPGRCGTALRQALVTTLVRCGAAHYGLGCHEMPTRCGSSSLAIGWVL